MSEAYPLSYCGRQCREHDRDRYLCALFAAPRRREGLFALAAFNNELAQIATIVSQPMLGLIRLQWWRDALVGLARGEVLAHPVIEALAEAKASFPLDVDLLHAAIDAREREMDDVPIVDTRQLFAFVDATSGGLNEAGAVLLGADAQQRQAARAAGRAHGLMRLVAVTRQMAAAGRTLLPDDALRAERIDLTQLAEGEAAHRLQGLLDEIVRQADADITQARAVRAGVAASLRPALLLTVLAARDLAAARRRGMAMTPEDRPPWLVLELAWRHRLNRY